MKRLCFFDAKPYDKIYFDPFAKEFNFEILYCDSKLNEQSVVFAQGCDAVVAFVNDRVNGTVIQALSGMGISVVALRCAGYNNVDFKEAYGKVHIVRVPAYSPYAVAEFAMGLLLTVNRKLHKAYNRTREYNFNINGLSGMDLYGKTVGVIGTGKIGQVFVNICKGFGMRVLAYDIYPNESLGYEYVDLDTLFSESDVISLHCPLTDKTWHIIDEDAISKMKKHCYIINTSRGGLIDSKALLEALQERRLGGAALDVYEEEAEFFFEDHSEKGITDATLALLSTMPNVLITSHQAFFTEEALSNIAKVTLDNMDAYFAGDKLENEVQYTAK